MELKIENNIASLFLDLPSEKVNKLTSSVLLELEKNLDKLSQMGDVNLLVIRSKKDGNFIAGADINEIKNIKNPQEAIEIVSLGQKIIDKIARLNFPSLAVINGSCLGGGLELALACTYRVATRHPKVQMGLPEVNLGIIPGFGGTQRLPKLIELTEAIDMIVSGKTLNADKAYKIGLVDYVISEVFVESQLADFIGSVLNSKKILKARKVKFTKKFALDKLLFLKNLKLHFARKLVLKKTEGNYPAPIAALDAIKDTYLKRKISDGLGVECQYFAGLVVGNISKNLIDIFFASENLKKRKIEVDSTEIKNALVIGAGIMGGGIAWLLSKNNIKTIIKDVSYNAIAIGLKQIHEIYGYLVKTRKMHKNEVNTKIHNVHYTTDYLGFDKADIVVEAATENLDIKRKIFDDVENRVAVNTIIASNTSSLSINEMATSLKNPERFIGMHFFNPVNKMPLVEIIAGDKTSKKAIATVLELTKELGKIPVIVKDVPGFLVNRILIPYINEAVLVLENGMKIEDVAKASKMFGMPMDPFTLGDIVGLDVGYKAGKNLEKGYGERMKCSVLLEEMVVEKELLGKKTGAGFYNYKNDKVIGVNKQVYEILNGISKLKDLETMNLKNTEMEDRMILIMVNEAARCIEENVVENPQDLDIAMIMGAGFPAFRGGLLKYCDDEGVKNIVARLEMLEKSYGERFKPADLLIKMVKEDKKFY